MNRDYSHFEHREQRNLRICLFLVLLYMLGLAPLLLKSLILSVSSARYIRPLSLYFVFIPSAYMFYRGWAHRKTVTIPYVGWMSGLIFVQLVTEMLVLAQGHEVDFHIVRRHVEPYFYFVLLVNFSSVLIRFGDYLRDFSIAIGVAYVLAIYLGYLGIIEMKANMLTGQISVFHDRPLNALYHPNQVSYFICALLALYCVRLHQSKILGRFESYAAPCFLVSCVFVVSVNATRAALVPCMLFGFLMLRGLFQYSALKTGMTLAAFSTLALAALALSPDPDQLVAVELDDLHVVQRLEEHDDMRIRSSVSGLTNFISSPITGVGMAYAGRVQGDGNRRKSDRRRSNNQFAQNLGAGGLVLFLVWILAYSKIYLGPLLRSRYIVFKLIGGYLIFFLLFQRPVAWWGLFAWLAYEQVSERTQIGSLKRFG